MPRNDPPHPGFLVRDIVEDLELKVGEAASRLGVTRQSLSRLLNGHCSISPDMAMRLEVVFGSSVGAWLRMQAAFDAAQVEKRRAEITSGLRPAQPSGDAG